MPHHLTAPLAVVVRLHGDQLLLPAVGLVELPRVAERDEVVAQPMEEHRGRRAACGVRQGHQVLRPKGSEIGEIWMKSHKNG